MARLYIVEPRVCTRSKRRLNLSSKARLICSNLANATIAVAGNRHFRFLPRRSSDRRPLWRHPRRLVADGVRLFDGHRVCSRNFRRYYSICHFIFHSDRHKSGRRERKSSLVL